MLKLKSASMSSTEKAPPRKQEAYGHLAGQSRQTPFISIPPEVIEEAVNIVLRRTRHITKETALHFDQTEPVKRQAWRGLHQCEITASNVVIILEAWTHREIATFGDQARPDRQVLYEWAEKVENILHKALKAFSRL